MLVKTTTIHKDGETSELWINPNTIVWVLLHDDFTEIYAGEGNAFAYRVREAAAKVLKDTPGFVGLRAEIDGEPVIRINVNYIKSVYVDRDGITVVETTGGCVCVVKSGLQDTVTMINSVLRGN